jgi:mannose-6-phosphate isomerase
VIGERDERPWGYFEILGGGIGYQVKRLCLHPGERLSYQRHTARSEHWYVVSGTGHATIDGDEVRIGPGDVVDVPVGTAHRVANIALQGDLVMIEVQTGSYFGEDDIERLADDYGRDTVVG